MLGMAMRGVVGIRGIWYWHAQWPCWLGMCTRFLIRQWRQYWPDLPFIVQQKPSGQGRNTWGRLAPEKAITLKCRQPTRSTRGPVVQAYEYLTIKEEANTWMVNTMDLITGVHPGRKDVELAPSLVKCPQ